MQRSKDQQQRQNAHSCFMLTVQLGVTMLCTSALRPHPQKSECSGCVLLSARRVGKQVVNIPSFMVRVDSQKHIDFALTSPFGGGRPGRVKRKSQA